MLDLILLAADGGFAKTFFEWFIENANYWFVFIFMVVESSFIPFPSELVVPPAAYLACANFGVGADMNVYMVVVMATLGALVGAYINYYLALWVGRPVVYRLADTRFAHALMINREKVERAEKYFDRHGAVSTLIGRLIPVIRQLISLPAGISKMNILQFTIFTTIGALIWNAILGALGYWLSIHVDPNMLFDKVEEYNGYLSIGGWILLVLCVLYILWNAFKPTKRSEQCEGGSPNTKQPKSKN